MRSWRRSIARAAEDDAINHPLMTDKRGAGMFIVVRAVQDQDFCLDGAGRRRRRVETKRGVEAGDGGEVGA